MVLGCRKPHDRTEEDEHLVFQADVVPSPGRRQHWMACARQNVLLARLLAAAVRPCPFVLR
eukprot:6769654-Pyramimonas_sp.AAC.1